MAVYRFKINMRLRGWKVEGPDGICFRVRSPIFSNNYYWRIGNVEYSFKPNPDMTLYRNGEIIAEGSWLLPFEPNLWKTEKSYFRVTLFKWVIVVRNGRTHKIVIAIGQGPFCGQFSTNSKHPNMISFALANYLPTGT